MHNYSDKYFYIYIKQTNVIIIIHKIVNRFFSMNQLLCIFYQRFFVNAQFLTKELSNFDTIIAVIAIIVITAVIVILFFMMKTVSLDPLNFKLNQFINHAMFFVVKVKCSLWLR